MNTKINNKWIMPLFLFLIFISFIALNSSCSKPETLEVKRPESVQPPIGPIVDTGLVKSGEFMNKTESINDPKTLAQIGDEHFESYRYPEAIEAYEKALKLNPKDVDTYNDLGLALHYTERSEKALEVLRKGIDVNPSFQRIWLSLGFVLTATGKDDEAQAVLNKTIALNPDSKQAQEAKRLLVLIKAR